MVQKLDTLQESPSQTAGPYVHIGLMPTYAGNAGYYDEEIGTTPFIDESKAQGEIIEIVGSVYDGTGWAMRDALIESWQCDASGIFPGAEGADPADARFFALVDAVTELRVTRAGLLLVTADGRQLAFRPYS